MEKQYEPPVDMKDVNKAGKFHIPVQEVGNEVTYKEVTKDQYTMFNALNQKSMEMKYKLETMAKQIKKEHNLDFDPIEIATSANALQKHEEKCLAKLNQQQGQQQTPTKSGPAIG